MEAVQSKPVTRTRIKADLILLTVAIIWGSGFIPQRIAAVQMPFYLFNFLRIMLAGLIFLPLALRSWKKMDRSAWVGCAVTGAILFGGLAFQQAGMRYTYISNTGFITGLYVVFVPIIMAVIYRQIPRWSIWVASVLAVLGMFLLSTGGQFRLAYGDLLVLIGAIFWALHVVWIGRMVGRVEVLQLSVVQYFVCGVLNLLLMLLAREEINTGLVIQYGWTVVYSAVFSVGLGFTLQGIGQRTAPAADAAILLSMEAVFASLFGWVILGEAMTAVQVAGCVLMFSGMLLAQVHGLKS